MFPLVIVWLLDLKTSLSLLLSYDLFCKDMTRSDNLLVPSTDSLGH